VKVQGQWQFEAERELVWQTLTDPNIVAQCIPGCEKMEPTGDDTYLATMAVGVGSVKGRFTATIRLTDQQFPERYRLIVEAKSSVGFVKGDGIIALQEVAEGQTQVSIDGEVQIGGTLASVGSRLLQAAANAQLNRFFEAMRQQVAQLKGTTAAPEELTEKPTDGE
jgi:carbon monoxide dehydrogenase subunit G